MNDEKMKLTKEDFLYRGWQILRSLPAIEPPPTMSFIYPISATLYIEIFHLGKGTFELRELIFGNDEAVTHEAKWDVTIFKIRMFTTDHLDSVMNAFSIPNKSPKREDISVIRCKSIKDSIMEALKPELSNYYDNISRRLQVIEEKIWPQKIDFNKIEENFKKGAEDFIAGNDINKDAEGLLFAGHGFRRSYESDKPTQAMNGPLTPMGEATAITSTIKELLRSDPTPGTQCSFLPGAQDVKIVVVAPQGNSDYPYSYTLIQHSKFQSLEITVERDKEFSKTFWPPIAQPAQEKTITVEEENRSAKYPRILIHKSGAIQSYPVGMEMTFDPEKHFLCINLETLSPKMDKYVLGVCGETECAEGKVK